MHFIVHICPFECIFPFSVFRAFVLLFDFQVHRKMYTEQTEEEEKLKVPIDYTSNSHIGACCHCQKHSFIFAACDWLANYYISAIKCCQKKISKRCKDNRKRDICTSFGFYRIFCLSSLGLPIRLPP